MRVLALAGLCLALSGCLSACGTTNLAGAAEVIDAAYGHCDRKVRYTARIGPLNPGSGAELTAEYDCKGKPKEAPEAPVE